jgi:hypothetical protein
MQTNINFHIWYKVCRPLKYKYKLSANELLMLSGSYLLYKSTNKPFTRLQLRNFLSYYNNNKVNYYISVLIDKKYIELVNSSKTGKVLYYSISLAGIQVINDLNSSYELELSKFCQQYNINL